MWIFMGTIIHHEMLFYFYCTIIGNKIYYKVYPIIFFLFIFLIYDVMQAKFCCSARAVIRYAGDAY